MKILYWTGLFRPYIGGAEIIGEQLIRALQERGHEFIVLTTQSNPGFKEREYYGSIPVYRIPFHTGLNNIAGLKLIKNKVEELKNTFLPDLVHLNSIDASIFFHLLTEDPENKTPTLFTVHSLPPYKINEETLVYKMLCSARWITTASEAMLTAVRGIVPENTHCLSLIYYGLKMPGIRPTVLQFEEPRLLCLGRVVEEKGFDIALNAFAGVVPHYPKAKLVIAGDGPAKHNLEQNAAGLGITGSVEFTGWVQPENIPELINSAAIVIVPSRWEEPFGLAALQASQMARPVIASYAGGLPEVVEHQKTGLLFEKDNTAGLTEQIIFLLNHKKAAEQMGQSGYAAAERKFGFDRYVNAFDDLYRSVGKVTYNI